jgi:hypothetical protein
MPLAVTSLHRTPRKQQRQRDALGWQMPRGDPAEPRPTYGTERRGDERHGGGGYRVRQRFTDLTAERHAVRKGQPNNTHEYQLPLCC